MNRGSGPGVASREGQRATQEHDKDKSLFTKHTSSYQHS